MKKIRIDHYNYRIRKGRADILLQKRDGMEYCIPFHYVGADERLPLHRLSGNMEDDGDLVFNVIMLNDCHMDKKGREWVPLTNLPGLTLVRNDSLHILHNILRFFLSRCPEDGNTEIIRNAGEMLDDVLVRIARQEYVSWLQELLERKRPLVLDAHVSPADPALVQREMETLEHFQVFKPDNPLDEELLRGGKYRFDTDFEAFGCKIEGISIIKDSCFLASLFDEEEETKKATLSGGLEA